MLANLLCSTTNGVGLGKCVSQIHRGRYYVAVRRGGEDVKQDISVSIERLFQADTLKIVLWDEEDPTFLCVVRVTRADYDELKKQQGLLIDFDNFPAQLVRLLQQCAASNMFLILQQNDPRQYYLEVVEHNEFKRLVHLSLRTTAATDADLRSHMVDTIAGLKKSLIAAKNVAASSEVAWGDKCSSLENKIQELELSLARMEEDIQRRETEHRELLKIEKDRMNQERLEWHRNMELTSKTHASSLQETIARKDKQLEEMSSRCRQLKDNVASLEGQLSEKTQRIGLLEKEVQKTHIEVATLRAKNSALERDSMEKERQIHHTNTKYSELEKILRDTNEQVKELSARIQTLLQEKFNLEQKLSLSESLVNKNNHAVQTTSEQLLKANQIISKQNTDLIELKEKLICRTAIVLEQEKEIERSAKEMESLKKLEEERREECNQLRGERDTMGNKLDGLEKSLKEKEENLKNNNMVIQWLHKKMEQLSLCDQPWDSSKRADTGTTRVSSNVLDLSDSPENTEDTSTSRRTQDCPSKSDTARSGKSIDPRYLQPADDDKASKQRLHTARGKENIVTNLPKVDYNPKKSARNVKMTSAAVYYPR